MTLFEAGLFTFLSAVATSAASRVYPLRLPEGATLPAMTYFMVSKPHEYTQSGPSKLEHPRYQIDCWGEKYLDAKSLAAQVKAAIDGYVGMMGGSTVQAGYIEDERDNVDPDTGRHWASLDVEIWNKA